MTWRSKPGPSHAYQRLLRGDLTSERYVAIVKRAVTIGRRGTALGRGVARRRSLR